MRTDIRPHSFTIKSFKFKTRDVDDSRKNPVFEIQSQLFMSGFTSGSIGELTRIRDAIDDVIKVRKLKNGQKDNLSS